MEFFFALTFFLNNSLLLKFSKFSNSFFLIGKKIENKSVEKNIPSQIKNQLKSTNQIKTNPIKNLSKENI